MDPDACAMRILDAVELEDWTKASTALEDLHRWLNRGGFPPEGRHLDTLQLRTEASPTMPADVRTLVVWLCQRVA